MKLKNWEDMNPREQYYRQFFDDFYKKYKNEDEVIALMKPGLKVDLYTDSRDISRIFGRDYGLMFDIGAGDGIRSHKGKIRVQIQKIHPNAYERYFELKIDKIRNQIKEIGGVFDTKSKTRINCYFDFPENASREEQLDIAYSYFKKFKEIILWYYAD